MTDSAPTACWHVLQISDVLDEEFSTALARLVPVVAWRPQRTLVPWREASSAAPDPVHAGLWQGSFMLPRGYARFPRLARIGSSLLRQIGRATPDLSACTLLCTAPYFAPVAELWPGRVVYWLTDLIARYGSSQGIDVAALDRRMVAAADLVCPNSHRIADYLMEQAGCEPSRIVIVPNATRQQNLLPSASSRPGPLPPDVIGVTRPVAGVIGNLAGNMDWPWIEQTMLSVPAMSWIFVGPTSMPIADAAQSSARERVMRSAQAHFAGRKPYGELAQYARSFDVAVLPYLRCEPTYSGSSTRFYEHLAACRPMIATRGFAELTRMEPLLQLVDSPAEAADVLRRLLRQDFDDGQSEARWRASQHATWQVRSAAVVHALEARRPLLARIA